MNRDTQVSKVPTNGGLALRDSIGRYRTLAMS